MITTTTDEEVFTDDETRFVSSWIDTSREQSLAILKARAKGPRFIDRRDLPVWQAAMSALKYKKAILNTRPNGFSTWPNTFH